MSNLNKGRRLYKKIRVDSETNYNGVVKVINQKELYNTIYIK